LQEEKAVNEEVVVAKTKFKESQKEIDATVERIRQECKVAIEDIMKEVGS
jgi:hypothetical protein